ncbi:MAG: hypothetical protein H6838_13625 [Planctomycetes bacterium]|nr:hypothetical protein [Planctomycetota bacterium]
MGNRIVWLLAAAIGCGACSSDTGPAMAAAAFESFQGPCSAATRPRAAGS